jgi:uncharacterized protein YlzI (FlbEa/FlbD family)
MIKQDECTHDYIIKMSDGSEIVTKNNIIQILREVEFYKELDDILSED